ncbi:hypothetical protein [Helicobacter sp. MIT 14-3879]|uniref:hypothetical protein n=1 Tax=Helicobacter sp. MIT 14-3879 TaxID=2040649 RepID=UPI000E1F4B8C|nr:hypothetical protein [Helicobacter sp. MIT 14-3879]RDU61842.1 hypothetical protein CQA44_07905 [Helicobacter sp. MIT 14-3879]
MLNNAKKIFLLLILLTQLKAIDLGNLGNMVSGGAGGILGGITGNGLSSLFDSFNNISGGAVGLCYYNSNIRGKIDICSQFNNINNLQQNMCSILPDIGNIGFQKKTNYIGISGAGLQQFCNSNVNNRLNNVISNLGIYDSQYRLSDGINLPNGKNIDDYFSKVVNVKNILVSNKETYAKSVILNSDQSELKALVDMGKISNIQSLNDLDINSFQAPTSMSDYFNQRDGLSASITNDLIISSPVNVSGVLKQKLQNKKGSEAEKIANQYIAEINEKIDVGTPKRIGLAIDVAAQSTDLAIPTNDYVKYMKPEVRPRLILKINNQIKREAMIQSKIVLADEIRKNLVSLSGQKAVIMNEKFDSSKAEQEINNLIK